MEFFEWKITSIHIIHKSPHSHCGKEKKIPLDILTDCFVYNWKITLANCVKQEENKMKHYYAICNVHPPRNGLVSVDMIMSANMSFYICQLS